MSQEEYHTDGPEPRLQLVTRKLSEIEPQRIRWLWPDRIPEGKFTMFAGVPAVGKSIIALDVASRVTTGQGWPDNPEPFEPGRVFILAAEDDPADTIRPRLEILGADLDRVEIIDGAAMEDKPEDVKSFIFDRHIEALHDEQDVKLLIVDTLSHYLIGNLNRHDEAKQALRPLVLWAMESRAAVIGIEHLGKDNAKSPLQRVMGSTAIAGQARAVWGFGEDKNDPHRSVMLPLKMNLAPNNGGLAYRLESEPGNQHPKVNWDDEPVTESAQEMFSHGGKSGEVSGRTQQAMDWLSEKLADGEPQLTHEVYEAGEAAGFHSKLLRTAFHNLGGKPEKREFSGKWQWQLPKTDAPCPPSSTRPPSSAFVRLRAKTDEDGRTANTTISQDGRRRTNNSSPDEDGQSVSASLEF